MRRYYLLYLIRCGNVLFFKISWKEKKRVKKRFDIYIGLDRKGRSLDDEWDEMCILFYMGYILTA